MNPLYTKQKLMSALIITCQHNKIKLLILLGKLESKK